MKKKTTLLFELQPDGFHELVVEDKQDYNEGIVLTYTNGSKEKSVACFPTKYPWIETERNVIGLKCFGNISGASFRPVDPDAPGEDCSQLLRSHAFANMSKSIHKGIPGWVLWVFGALILLIVGVVLIMQLNKPVEPIPTETEETLCLTTQAM